MLCISNFKWILIPLSILLGYFIIAAEPAVHVLKKEVEEIQNQEYVDSNIDDDLGGEDWDIL